MNISLTNCVSILYFVLIKFLFIKTRNSWNDQITITKPFDVILNTTISHSISRNSLWNKLLFSLFRMIDYE